MTKFISFMDEAIKEAQQAFEQDEVPVGVVIVDSKNNQIIARSHNSNISKIDATAHSEILAIREACKNINNHRLDDCDLYVTLEPCVMCAGAISLARIRRVYYGTEDKKFGAVNNGAKVFDSSSCHHKPEVYSGLNEKESQKLLKEFFAKKRSDKKATTKAL